MLFMETAPGPPKQEKYYVNVSLLGCTGMHYVSRRSHWRQKYKFGVMCPSVLFMVTAPGPPEHEKNSVSMCHALNVSEFTM
jgi:hypothetical protein